MFTANMVGYHEGTDKVLRIRVKKRQTFQGRVRKRLQLRYVLPYMRYSLCCPFCEASLWSLQ
ncbi:hypothetical protein CRI94_10220 [Longibacter salinarum]|uniref:Uncharacterized protein n=1 Tax=Longibacter salinarum TaxID=1850348 RepID=A0A2A8CWN1_9BACT|nr:hypothetical protein CRI94_10220 [Longibacter salinarum]